MTKITKTVKPKVVDTNAILRKRIGELRGQLSRLAKVLTDEFGGPAKDEAVVEAAIRVMREQKRSTDTAKLTK